MAAASPKGWNADGNAMRVTAEAAGLARRLLDAVDIDRAPWVGPSPDGGLQLIWIISGREAQADIVPDGSEVLIFGGASEPIERRATELDQVARDIQNLLRGTR